MKDARKNKGAVPTMKELILVVIAIVVIGFIFITGGSQLKAFALEQIGGMEYYSSSSLAELKAAIQCVYDRCTSDCTYIDTQNNAGKYNSLDDAGYQLNDMNACQCTPIKGGDNKVCDAENKPNPVKVNLDGDAKLQKTDPPVGLRDGIEVVDDCQHLGLFLEKKIVVHRGLLPHGDTSKDCKSKDWCIVRGETDFFVWSTQVFNILNQKVGDVVVLCQCRPDASACEKDDDCCSQSCHPATKKCMTGFGDYCADNSVCPVVIKDPITQFCCGNRCSKYSCCGDEYCDYGAGYNCCPTVIGNQISYSCVYGSCPPEG